MLCTLHYLFLFLNLLSFFPHIRSAVWSNVQMIQAKTWVLRQHFEGSPKDSDFELKVEQIPEPKDGGIAPEFTDFRICNEYFILFFSSSAIGQVIDKLLTHIYC